jgi:hypothetical protein
MAIDLFIPSSLLLSHLITQFWVYSIFSGLNARLPEGNEIGLGSFRVMYMGPMLLTVLVLLSTVYIALVVNGYEKIDISPDAPLSGKFYFHLWALYVFSIIVFIQGIRVAAKTITSIGSQNGVSFGEYLSELLLIMLFGVGLWLLQPRINRIMEGAYDKQLQPQ